MLLNTNIQRTMWKTYWKYLYYHVNGSLTIVIQQNANSLYSYPT